jgi:putative transcriptional regulator
LAEHYSTAAPSHGRLIDPLLAGYAMGSLEPCMHALIEAHLILSEENRGFVRALEDQAAAELEDMPVRPIGRAARDHILGAIYAGGWYGYSRPASDPDLPQPLLKLAGGPLDAQKWRFYGFGVQERTVFSDTEVTAQLIKVKPGKALPSHTHEGVEATLVLRGAYRDETGRYRRGDVAVADAAIDHRPIADPETGCVCFAVTEGKLKLTGSIGRLLNSFMG